MGFGECPKCGKMTLIRRKRRDFWDNLIDEVKCVNPECGFEEEIGVVEEEDEDIEDDIEEEEEEEEKEEEGVPWWKGEDFVW